MIEPIIQSLRIIMNGFLNGDGVKIFARLRGKRPFDMEAVAFKLCTYLRERLG